MEQSVRSCMLCLNKVSDSSASKVNQNNYKKCVKLKRIVTIEEWQSTEILCQSCSSCVDESCDFIKSCGRNIAKMPVEAGDLQQETQNDAVTPVINELEMAVFDKNLISVDELEIISALEKSYIHKCKAMIEMCSTLKCACHSEKFFNFKGLLSHLRYSNIIWFPPYTCYHCMITFVDKTAIAKHNHRCRGEKLKRLIQLSNLKTRSLEKARLYQSYRCSECKFIFSFFEDFRKHVDQEHIIENAVNICWCGKFFNSLENYKNHLYSTCMVEFYCGICTTVVKTPVEFLDHSRHHHDNAPGFSFIQENNKKRKSFEVSQTDNEDVVNAIANNEQITPKRVRRGPKCPTECPQCGNIYSNMGNMIRHFKTHKDKKPYVNGLPQEETNPVGITNTVDNVQSPNIYPCHICYMVLPNEASLKHHVYAKHSDRTMNGNNESQLNQEHSLPTAPTNSKSPSLSCKICPKQFFTPKALWLHQICHKITNKNETHEESKPISHTQTEEHEFECEECTLNLPTSVALQIHQIEKHPRNIENLIFKCEPCDSEYNYEEYKKHRDIHEMLETQQNIRQSS